MKIERKKIFCDPSKILKNISWPINICLKYFTAPTKTHRPLPASYMFSVRSLRSFLILSNNSFVNVVQVNVNVDSYLNSKFFDHDFQSKPESNNKNFKSEILLSVFSLMFYYIFLKHNGELRIKIFEFVILISVLNIMKYFNHSEVFDGIKTCSQLHFFAYESTNTCDTVETSCLHSDFVFFSISKLQYRNSNSYFNLLLLLSDDLSLNPGPLHSNQLQTQSEWSVFNSRGLHFIHLRTDMGEGQFAT